MTPRHLFVRPISGVPNHWAVFIGDIDVGRVQRTNGYAFTANSELPGVDRASTTTMAAMKERLVELIDKATYERILDFAFKNGYEG